MGKYFFDFREPDDIDSIISAVLNDTEERRWQSARRIARIESEEGREAVRAALDAEAMKDHDWKQMYRFDLARRMINEPLPDKYVIVRGKGALTREEYESGLDPKESELPVIDFHVHPKASDARLMTDIRDGGLSHMVILATDTDPEDIDREDIQEHIFRMHSMSFMQAMEPPFLILQEIRNSLYSPGHVTNQDVADRMADFPDQLIGFGSVDLCKSPEYVDLTLRYIKDLGLKGIKLLPFSQFFDPETCANMDLLFQHCRDNGWPILTHTGCSAGVFEDPAFNQESRPLKWHDLAKKYPDVPIVMAHLGAYSAYYPGIWLDETMAMIREFDNVYADTAAVAGVLNDERFVRQMRDQGGKDVFRHILYGTDYSSPAADSGMPNIEKLIIDEIRTSPLLTDEEKENILGLNAARVLGI